MEVKKDGEIREFYGDMMKSMTRLVRNEKDAFSIIWFDIYDWLEPEHSAMKADLCGVLTEKIIGENIGTRVFVPIQNNTEYYQMIQRKYALGKRIGALGEYWKELIREEKYFRLGVLYACLYNYYRVIIPYVKNEMTAWCGEVLQEHPELLPTLKPYKAHRAKIKTAMQIIETASDVLMLQRMGEDQEENR